MFLSLITISIISRQLGVENFGIFNLTLGNLIIFMSISKLGLDHILVKHIVNNNNNNKYISNLLNNAFSIRLIGGLLFGSLFYIFNIFINSDINNISIITLILVPSIFSESLTVSNSYFDANLKTKYYTFSKLISLIIGSILKISLVVITKKIEFLVVAVTIEFLILSLLEYYFYNKVTSNRLTLNLNIDKFSSLLRESWPLLIESIIAILVLRFDQIIIKVMLNNHELGIYSAVSRLFQIWFIIPVIVVNSFYPSLIQKFGVNISEFSKEIRKVSLLLMLIAVSIIVVIFFSAPIIIDKMFGVDYKEGILILQVQSFALIFQFLGILYGRSLIILNKQKLLLFRNVLILGINILINILLINYIGLMASAISTIIAFFIGHILIYLFNKDTRKLFYA